MKVKPVAREQRLLEWIHYGSEGAPLSSSLSDVFQLGLLSSKYFSALATNPRSFVHNYF
jgi:hypothetical protein